MNQRYGYAYEFIRMNGVYLKVTGANKRLAETDLSPVSVRMLEHNRIPGLLNLSVERMDADVTLLYAISGKRMLSQELRGVRLNMQHVYQMLIRVATILKEARAYLLREESFVLHSDMMFVGESWNDLYLLYLPVRELEEQRSAQEQLKETLLEWLDFVHDVPGQEWKRLMQDFRTKEWDISQLCKQWIEHLAEPASDLHDASETGLEDGPGHEAMPEAQSEDEPEPSLERSVHEKRIEGIPWGHEYVRELIPLPEAATAAWLKSPNVARLKRIDRGRVIKIGALVALLAASVGLLLPSLLAKYIFLGTLAVASLGIGMFFWRELDREKHGEPLWDESKVRREQELSTEERVQTLKYDHSAEMLTDAPLHERTTVLSAEERTSLLSPTPSSPIPSHSPRAFLDCQRGGDQERRELAVLPFVIGRDQQANWRQDETGVSRFHCEITMDEQGRHTITDLGSRNGCYLNGQLLVPYTPYTLQPLDQIRIVDTSYTFTLT